MFHRDFETYFFKLLLLDFFHGFLSTEDFPISGEGVRSLVLVNGLDHCLQVGGLVHAALRFAQIIGRSKLDDSEAAFFLNPVSSHVVGEVILKPNQVLACTQVIGLGKHQRHGRGAQVLLLVGAPCSLRGNQLTAEADQRGQLANADLMRNVAIQIFAAHAPALKSKQDVVVEFLLEASSLLIGKGIDLPFGNRLGAHGDPLSLELVEHHQTIGDILGDVVSNLLRPSSHGQEGL